MLTHQLLHEEGILLIRPDGPLEADDFTSVAKSVDPYIKQEGGLRGVMVEALPRSCRTCALFATITDS